MNWLVLSLVCFLGWGFADLFYKFSSEEEDKESHLKIAVWVGIVMGVSSFVLMPFSESGFSFGSLMVNIAKYMPASLAYIISMVIGYAGLRYLELSIVSPIQNASGALSMIAMIVYFMIKGSVTDLSEEYSVLEYIGTAVIIIGVILLAVVEKKLAKEDEAKEDKKYKIGALAIFFPILYCVFDTIGTAADGIILSEESGMELGEIDVLILYGLTFFAAAVVAWFVILFKDKKVYNPFEIKELRTKGVAALAEEFGQVFYVFAMAEQPVLAAPVVASYCIMSVILSRIIVKEKLSKAQYACVILVLVGIVMLGISEGISEM